MRIKILLTLFLCLFFAGDAAAQGGKAEPNRISFAKGKSSASIPGSLKNGEEYEMVFGAKAGQKVKVTLKSTTPKGNFHYFSLLGDGFDFQTEFDKNNLYEFTAPETGDYLLTIYFNATDKVRSGKFLLTLSITN